MYGHQLQTLIEGNAVLSDCSRGIFARDTLPRGRLLPGLYLVNSEVSTHPTGKHWLAFAKDADNPDTLDFYDSLGRPPSHYKIAFHHERIIYFNDAPIQGATSINCGKYCLHFMYFKSMGASMEEVVGMFTTSKERNERIIDVFFNNLFPFTHSITW